MREKKCILMLILMAILSVGNVACTRESDELTLIETFADLKAALEKGETEINLETGKTYTADADILVKNNFIINGNNSVLDMRDYRFLVSEKDAEFSDLTLKGSNPLESSNLITFSGTNQIESEVISARDIKVSGLFEMIGGYSQINSLASGTFEVTNGAVVAIEGNVTGYENFIFGKDSVFMGYKIESDSAASFEIMEGAKVNLETALHLETPNIVELNIHNKAELDILGTYPNGQVPFMINGAMDLKVHQDGIMIVSSEEIGMILGGNQQKDITVDGFLSVTGMVVAEDQPDLSISAMNGGKIQLESFNEEMVYGTLHSTGTATYTVDGEGSQMTILHHSGIYGAILHDGPGALTIDIVNGGNLYVYNTNSSVAGDRMRAAITSQNASGVIHVSGAGSLLNVINENTESGAISLQGNLTVTDGGNLIATSSNLSPTLEISEGRLILDQPGEFDIRNLSTGPAIFSDVKFVDVALQVWEKLQGEGGYSETDIANAWIKVSFEATNQEIPGVENEGLNSNKFDLSSYGRISGNGEAKVTY